MELSELKKIVRKAVNELDDMGPGNDLQAVIQPIRDAGIINDMHVGREPKEFDEQMKVEWYAGQLLDVIDKQAWYAMNSIINYCDVIIPKT